MEQAAGVEADGAADVSIFERVEAAQPELNLSNVALRARRVELRPQLALGESGPLPLFVRCRCVRSVRRRARIDRRKRERRPRLDQVLRSRETVRR